MAASASALPDEKDYSEDDRFILENVDQFLAEGLELKTWFDRALATETLNTFELVETYNRPDRSRAFFGKADLERGTIPVMGVIDEVFYDQPKPPGKDQAEFSAATRDQIREFLLRYFLRISDFRRPQGVAEPGGGALADLLAPISWRSKPELERDGMGFNQVYYKPVGGGAVQPFPADLRNEVVDLREIGKVYDWIILKLQVYQFNVSMKPLGSSAPQFMVPLKEESYLVVTPDFIRNVDDPEKGVLGEYGFGYAFVKNPKRGPFAYGPGEFGVAFQTINFRVLDNGQVWVRMVFVSDQPQKIINLTLDPVEWSFTLADMFSFGAASKILAPFKSMLREMPFRDFNLDPTVPTLDWMNTLTAGQMAEQLSISKEELYKGFLRRHSLQHYQTVLGSLRTWRQVPDWLDTASIPEWVVKGWSS